MGPKRTSFFFFWEAAGLCDRVETLCCCHTPAEFVPQESKQMKKRKNKSSTPVTTKHLRLLCSTMHAWEAWAVSCSARGKHHCQPAVKEVQVSTSLRSWPLVAGNVNTSHRKYNHSHRKCMHFPVHEGKLQVQVWQE